MVVTVAAHKGGVGKSTTAVHVAAYLQKKAPTVLVDSDPNRSVCGWAVNGSLPFEVIPLSYQSLILTVELVKTVASAHYKALLTIVPPKPSRDGEEMRAELITRSIPLFKTGIRRFVAYQKAALAGVPVYKADDPRAEEAWSDYLSVGKEILRDGK